MTDLQGVLGSGLTFQSVLTQGQHIITLTAANSDGATGTDSISLTVSDPGESRSPVEVFSDGFEQPAWNGRWAEDFQEDWFRSTQRSTESTHSAEVDGRATAATLTSIPIEPQGRTDATITVPWLIEKGLDRGEYLAFDVSTDNGSTWVEQGRLPGNVDQEHRWHKDTFELLGISSLIIRFRAKMSNRWEDANIDKVQVTGH